LYGGGDGGGEDGGVPSGLLHGVAVGLKLLSPHGVATADGVTALIPRSLSNLARPNVVEKVVVEPRRLMATGVWGAVGCLEFATVHIWLPRRLYKNNLVKCTYVMKFPLV